MTRSGSTPRRTWNLLLLNTDQVLCAYNETRVLVNKSLRLLTGRVSKADVKNDLLDADLPVVGDRIMCLRNSKEQGLFNGMQGVVMSVNHAKRTLVFAPDGEDRRQEVGYVADAFNSAKKLDHDPRSKRLPFDYAYCATCHKMQGDQCNRLLVVEQRCRLWDHVRWAYTAASRARERLDWILG